MPRAMPVAPGRFVSALLHELEPPIDDFQVLHDPHVRRAADAAGRGPTAVSSLVGLRKT